MKTIKKAIFFLTMLLALASCRPLTDKVSFMGVEDVDFVPFNSLTVDVKVENRLRADIHVDDVDAVVYFDGRKVGTVNLAEEIVIERRSEQVVSVPLTVKLTNPLTALGLMGDMSDMNESLGKATFDITCRCRAKGISKSIERHNVPLSKFIPNFGEN